MIFIGGGAGLGPLWALLQYMDAKDIDARSPSTRSPYGEGPSTWKVKFPLTNFRPCRPSLRPDRRTNGTGRRG